jgi:hypothetical protein
MEDMGLFAPCATPDGSDAAFLADRAARIRLLGKRVIDTKATISKMKRQARRAAFEGLDIPFTSVSLLAAPSTPDAARDEIIARAKAGEKLSVADVKATIRRAKAEASR